MRKSFSLIIFVFTLAIVMLITCGSVNAKSVTSVNADVTEEEIVVSGTTESGVLAVQIMLYDEKEENIVLVQSAAVDNSNKYTCTLSAKAGTYVVKVADYDGGSFATKKDVVVESKKEEEKEEVKEEEKIIKVVNLTLEAPIIGEKVTSTLVDDGNMGGYEQDNKPIVKEEEKANYKVTDTMWIKGTYKEVGDDFEEPITATFEKDKYYYACIYISANDGFKLSADLEIKVNGEKPAEVFAVYADGQNTFFIAKIKAVEKEENKEEEKDKEEEVKDKKYTLEEDSFVLEFTDEEGKTFEFEIMDVSNLTDKQIEEANITKDEYKAIKEKISKSVKGQGTLLAIYNINVTTAGEYKTKGPFVLKIKMTEEMKKYDSFKLVYLDDNSNFEIKDTIELKAEGDYLVGTLPHLSVYALVAENEEATSESEVSENVNSNPKTGDSIMYAIVVLLASTLLLSACVVIKKKSN